MKVTIDYFSDEKELMQAIIDRTVNVEIDGPPITIKGQDEIISTKGRFMFNRKTRKYEPYSTRSTMSDLEFHDAQQEVNQPSSSSVRSSSKPSTTTLKPTQE